MKEETEKFWKWRTENRMKLDSKRGNSKNHFLLRLDLQVLTKRKRNKFKFKIVNKKQRKIF